MGLDLAPATDQPRIVKALTEFLQLPATPSAGHVVALDLQTVAVDLSAVPLDEVLAFRSERREMHRRYVRSARTFARELSLLPEPDRAAALSDRQEELEELANDLKRVARAAWKRPASFALGLAGATWRYHMGDPIGAILVAGALALGAAASSSTETGAFSYLFAAHERYD